jgi:hypothetical protein
VCAAGDTQQADCDGCSHQDCGSSCAWGGCNLKPGNDCEWQNGNHFLWCNEAHTVWQFCLSSCVWAPCQAR